MTPENQFLAMLAAISLFSVAVIYSILFTIPRKVDYITSEFYCLLDQKCLVEVLPLDSWDEWFYRITVEDCMAPMCVIYASDVNSTYPTHRMAMLAGIIKAKEILSQN